VVDAPFYDSSKGSVFVVRTAPDQSKKKTQNPFCFSAINAAFVKGKGVIPMHALRVGDFVHSGDQDQSFSRVLSFMHIDRDVEVEYLQIHMEHINNPLEVSHGHFLIKDTKNHAVRAQDIIVGDMLSGNKVTRISTIQRCGLYAPVTESGTIWVSGVTASCYVDILSSVMPTLQAHASHTALAPLRIMCAWKFSLCQNEMYSVDGYSSNLLAMTQFGLLLSSWNSVLQWLVVIVFSPVLIGVFALETWVSKHLLIAAVVFGSIARGLFFCICKISEKTPSCCSLVKS
jgi:hypothetical protein